ncbi:MAG: permease, partial [Anaerolineae bacterium]|nr:permease [Anaerolineae bacterium]
MASRINPLQDQKTQQRDFALVVLGVLVWWIIFNNLQPVADFVTYQLLALDPESHLGSAVNFFVYDVPKILLLLSGMIFLITLLRTFITPEQTRRWLGGKREGVG